MSVIGVIRNKGGSDEVLLCLEDLPNPLKDASDEEPPYNPMQIEVFTETILYVGSKSFSHSFSAIANPLR